MLNILHPLRQFSLANGSDNLPLTFPATRAQIARSLINKLNKPLVDTTDIQAHLDLLGVFYKIHHAINAEGIVVDDSTDLPIINAAQAVFLARAQHRFDLWIEKVLQRPDRSSNSPLASEEIPPVDVLMFIHTYMLNPRDYHEDTLRVYPCLAGMGAFPLKEVHALINLNTFELEPTADQVTLWESLTSTSFQPPLKTLPTDQIALSCPKCLAINNLPWLIVAKTEVEPKTSITCVACGLTINSEALSVGRFLKELRAPGPLAHTVLLYNGIKDLDLAGSISDAIRESLDISSSTDGDRFEWKIHNIEQALLKNADTEILKSRIKYIMPAYNHPTLSSLDLRSAVMRQGRFVDTIHDIQWSGQGSSFVGKQEALLDSVIRYHQFFALSSEITIPTLDIDLAFHTHQLFGAGYINDCMDILGRILDHSDFMDARILEENLPHDIKIWEDCFKTPYITNILPLSKPTPPHCDGGCHYCGEKGGHHTGTCPLKPNPPK